MTVKDIFLHEIKIGDTIDIMFDSQEISGIVISINLEAVCIRLESGTEQIISLDSISYYEIDNETVQSAASKIVSSEDQKKILKSGNEICYKTSIENVGFSPRTYNSLYRSGNIYLEDLADMSEGELLKIRNLGKKSLEEIIQKCEEYGIPTRTGFKSI